jgi:hypothetical protein
VFHVLVDWRYGVHPLIVEYIDSLDVDESRLQVNDENEVLILNPLR